jgi:hypothetical protein
MNIIPYLTVPYEFRLDPVLCIRLRKPGFTEHARSETESSGNTDMFVRFTYGSKVLCWTVTGF